MAADPRDLTTVAVVKATMSPDTPATDDGLLQRLVTAASVEMGRYCSRRFDATLYTEQRNGRGQRDAMETLQAPIISVTSVTIGAYAVPATTDNVSYGFIADEERIYIRGSRGYLGPCGWERGVMNITLVYWAGWKTPGQVSANTAGIPAGAVLLDPNVEQACIEYVILMHRAKGRIGDKSYGLGPDRIDHYLDQFTKNSLGTLDRMKRVNYPLR